MRSLCLALSGAVLTASLVVFAPGCGGSNELEKPPPPKPVDPMKDMPGLAEQQAKLKAAGKIK